jgi:hypothetical protein
MPWPAYRDRARLKLEILARVTAGETLQAVCAQPDHPSYASVYAWARADPAFAAELALAGTRGAHRRRWAFDEQKADALLVRLRAGEPIASILRDPAMPSRRVYAHWRATQAHFAEEVARLNGLRNQEKGHSRRRRYRPFDQDLADRILVRVARGEHLAKLLAADPALPGRGVLTRWREENPEYARALRTAVLVGRRVRGRAVVGCTPKLTAVIAARVRNGATLARLGETPGLPCATTLYGWMRRRPDFRDAVARAARDRAEGLAARVLDLAEAATPQTLAGTRRRIDALKARADRLAGKARRLARR